MPDRPRLEAVVFDAGGTLARLDYEWMAAAVSELDGAFDAEAMRRAEVEGRRRYDASFGPGRGGPNEQPGARGDIREYFMGLLDAAGGAAAAREAAYQRFHARQSGPGLWTRPMEGAREALDGIAALGLRRAVVSNSDGRAEHHLTHTGMREGLEFVVDSHLEGVEKPDPRIFRIALDRLGVPGSRALYVGDIRSVDEVGSRAAGMHFVLLDPYGDYADRSVDSIASIARLPEWVRARFSVPGAPGAGAASRRAS